MTTAALASVAQTRPPRLGFLASRYPTTFQRDLARYRRKLAQPPAHGGAVQPPDAIHRRMGDVHTAASILATLDGGPQSVSSLAQLVAPGNATRILDHYLASMRRSNSSARALAIALIALARDGVKVRKDDLAALIALRKRLDGPVAVSASSRAAMRSLEPLSMRRAMVAIPPPTLANTARHANSLPEQRRLLQTAVVIELLLHTGMRIGEIAALRTENIQKSVGDWIRVRSPRRVIGDEPPLEFELAGAPKRLIEQWLRDHVDSDGSALFAHDGQPARPNVLSKAVKDATRQYLGLTVAPKHFRHLCARWLLDARPGYYHLAKDLLGHRFLITTRALYADQEHRHAASAWNSHLDAQLREAA